MALRKLTIRSIRLSNIPSASYAYADDDYRLAEGILRQQQVKEEEERQQAYDARLRSLHHLLSTKSMPGVLDGLTLNDTIENDGVGAFDIESKIKTLNKSLHHRHMILKS